MVRLHDWWDSTYWHHRLVGNGWLWWACRDCRRLRRSD